MYKKSLFRRAALVLVLMVAVLATAASGEEDKATNSGGVTKGLGASDASKDVSSPTIVREGEAPAGPEQHGEGHVQQGHPGRRGVEGPGGPADGIDLT